MAIRGVDTSGILQAYGQLGQSRRYEEEKRRQEKLREEARQEQRRAERIGRNTAFATVAGSVAGFAVGGPAGASLGGSIGSIVGTAASGGEVQPGQAGSFVTSLGSYGMQQQQMQESRQINQAMLKSYGEYNPEFTNNLNEYGLDEKTALELNPGKLQSIISFATQMEGLRNQKQSRGAFNKMLINEYQSKPYAQEIPSANSEYKSLMNTYRTAPEEKQLQIHQRFMGGESTDNILIQDYLGDGATSLPSDFNKMPIKDKERVLSNLYLNQNRGTLEAIQREEYSKLPPEEQRKQLISTYTSFKTHPSSRVNSIADSLIKPKIDAVNKRLSASIDYEGLSDQVGKIVNDEATAQSILDGNTVFRVENGGVVPYPKDQAPEATYQDKFINNAAAGIAAGIERDASTKAAIKLQQISKSGQDSMGLLAEAYNLDPKKKEDAEKLLQIRQASKVLDRQEEELSKFIGTERARNTKLTKEVLDPPALRALFNDNKKGAFSLPEMATKFMTLDPKKQPLDVDTMRSFQRVGFDTGTAKTVGEVLDRQKSIKKQSNDIGTVSAGDIAAVRFLQTQAKKLLSIAPYSADSIGLIEGGIYRATGGRFGNKTMRGEVTPEQFELLSIKDDTFEGIDRFANLDQNGNPIVNPQTGKIPIEFKTSDLNAINARLTTYEVKDFSGAAVSDAEFSRLKEMLPFISDSYDTYISKIQEALNVYQQREQELLSLAQSGRVENSFYPRTGTIDTSSVPQSGSMPIQGQPSPAVQQVANFGAPEPMDAGDPNIYGAFKDPQTMNEDELGSYFDSLPPKQQKDYLDLINSNRK